MLRKNNVMKIDGNIGYATITVKYQGSRAMMKEVYENVSEFNHYWMPIDEYWERRTIRPRLNSYEKAMIDAFLERSKNTNLDRKYQGD